MKKELIAHKNPKSPVAESFRTLRTNIQFMNSKKNLRSILVTSTMPGEGKSWITSNLATTFAQAGKKVIIIDADMRKGRQHTIFSVESKPGLSNYLLAGNENEETDVLEYIKRTDISNLYLLTSGNVPPNPSELLTSEATIKMIEKLKDYFDILIFDGTPSLIVTDAMIVARLVDSTIIVTEHNETKKENLEKVKKSLESVGASVAGVILNKMPVSTKKYENSYYYGSKDTRTREYSDINIKINKEDKINDELNNYFRNKKGE